MKLNSGDPIFNNLYQPINTNDISVDISNNPDLNVNGNLNVDGVLTANKFNVNLSSIILNLDFKYIEDVLEGMDSEELNFLMRHLHKIKLLTEKKLLDRS